MNIIDRFIEWYQKKRTDKVLQDFGVVGELKQAADDLLVAIQEYGVGDCSMAELLRYADDLQEML